MPYCPRCDMEFIEGITVCSDCGGPLVESKEIYEAEEKARLQKEKSAVPTGSAPYENEIAGVRIAEGEFSGEEKENPFFSPEAGESEAAKPESAAVPRPTAARAAAPYVSSRQKSEDLRSSSSAFFLVGGIALAVACLCWAGVIRLPMAGASRLLFQGVLTAMGVIFLYVALSSRRAAAAAAARTDGEEQRTQELIQWFQEQWSGEAIDQTLHREDPTLEGEELELKRYELIQDRLITGQDLPDPSYVDYLTDLVYEKLYG